ncbi:MAG: hypothetical protein RDV48_20495 [Candidatus Eremiobacteraeota bacterium]|nr:hypothetical protein [Candidatus Eremiobacteraeota bacterium]
MHKNFQHRRDTRGLSLVELLVSIALFLSVVVFVTLTHRTGSQAFQKSRIDSDVYRMAMLAAEHMKKELHGAKVNSVTDDEVHYLIPQLENGHVKVADDGRIAFNTGEAVLSVGERHGVRYLIRTQNGIETRIAGLGNSGSATFSMPSTHVLQAEIRAEVTEAGIKVKESSYKVVTSFFLLNQNN